MNKAFISVICSLLLFGCGQQYQSYKFDNQHFTKEKAVVIMQVSPVGVEMELVKFAQADGSYFPLRDDKGYYTHAYHLKQYSLFPFGYPRPIVLMVDPGYYLFDHIQYQTGNTTYYTAGLPIRQANYNENFHLTWGGFYAEPGKVTYIGHLSVQYDYNALLFQHSYNDDHIHGFLTARYPPLVSQVTRGPYFAGMTLHEFLH